MTLGGRLGGMLEYPRVIIMLKIEQGFGTNILHATLQERVFGWQPALAIIMPKG